MVDKGIFRELPPKALEHASKIPGLSTITNRTHPVLYAVTRNCDHSLYVLDSGFPGPSKDTISPAVTA